VYANVDAIHNEQEAKKNYASKQMKDFFKSVNSQSKKKL
jgi:hypothetical protein